MALFHKTHACISLIKKIMWSLICRPLFPICIYNVLGIHNLTGYFYDSLQIPTYIWTHSHFAYCIKKTIYLERKICTVLGEVQPLGGLIYAPLTLYQAREKSLTNHFAPSAQPQQPSSTLFVRSLKGSRVKKTTSVLHVLNSMNRVLYNVRECQFLEL